METQAGDLILNANVLVAAGVAFAAGIVSFASPCVIPLVPGYVSYMTGLSGAELRRGGASSRVRILAGGLLFVLGFAVPFSLLGFIGGSLAVTLQSRSWQIVLGILVAVLGLAFTGLLPIDLLNRERRFTGSAVDRGVLGALPLGFVFGVGWVPCIGSALSAILVLGGATGTGPTRSGLLAFVYAIGLGLPFILMGLLFDYAGGALGFLRRNARSFQVAGGGMLMLVGVGIATGLWNEFIQMLLPVIGRFETAL